MLVLLLPCLHGYLFTTGVDLLQVQGCMGLAAYLLQCLLFTSCQHAKRWDVRALLRCVHVACQPSGLEEHLQCCSFHPVLPKNRKLAYGQSARCSLGAHIRNACLVESTIRLVRICRVNLGTADELALDMLINALSNFSRE